MLLCLIINVYPFRCVVNKYLFREGVKLRKKVVNLFQRVSQGYFLFSFPKNLQTCMLHAR